MTRIIAGPRRSSPWSGFNRLALAAAAALALTGIAVLGRSDPYWVLRERPPWYERGGGANRFLDLEMRRAKALQVQVRPARAVLVGSSTVYRGIDPAGLGVAAYNAGLPSLMAEELPTVASLVASRGDGAAVAIGLDYYMFTRFLPPPPLDPAYATAIGRLGGFAAAFMSLRALADSSAAQIVRTVEPGLWHRDGFKASPDLSPDVALRIARGQRHEAMVYEPTRLRYLDDALGRLAGRPVRLYLSPTTAVQRDLIAAAGHADAFARWRRDVAALAAGRGVPFADLVDSHPFDDYAPTRGSSRFWIDDLHFKPEVGRFVLDRLGLAEAARSVSRPRPRARRRPSQNRESEVE